MTGEGLVSVLDPSALFLADRRVGACGSVVTAVLEGTRPLCVEVQALVAADAGADAAPGRAVVRRWPARDARCDPATPGRYLARRARRVRERRGRSQASRNRAPTLPVALAIAGAADDAGRRGRHRSSSASSVSVARCVRSRRSAAASPKRSGSASPGRSCPRPPPMFPESNVSESTISRPRAPWRASPERAGAENAGREFSTTLAHEEIPTRRGPWPSPDRNRSTARCGWSRRAHRCAKASTGSSRPRWAR